MLGTGDPKRSRDAVRNTYCLFAVKSQSRLTISFGGCCRGGEKLVDAGPKEPSMLPRPMGFRGPVLLSFKLAPSARIMDLCLASVLRSLSLLFE